MPIIGKTNGERKSFRKLYEAFGLAFVGDEPQLRAESCPFCDGPKFGINSETGQYLCRRGSCDDGVKGGNHLVFIRKMHEAFLEDTSDEHYHSLRDKRGIGLQTLKRHGLAFDRTLERWLIPFKNPGGEVVNVQFYHPGNGRKANLPGLETCLYGIDRLSTDKEKIVFLCEGPFDTIALDYHLKNNRAKYDLVGMPGTFKEEWADFFKGRKVRALFDNDAGGLSHGKRVQRLLGEKGVTEELRLLKWPDGFPHGCDINDLVKDYPGVKVVGFALKHSDAVVADPKLQFEHGWELGDVKPEVIDWIWPNRLRCGTYVSYSGRRGTLKSTVMRDLVARYTRGEPMPCCDEPGMPAGHVLYITAEDNKETVWASLRLAGADLNRCTVHAATIKDGDPLNVLEHMGELRQLVRQYDIRLVIIDGQNSVVGAPNISTDMLARSNVTNRLHQFAQQENLCLVGIRNEDAEGRALGPQSMGDLGRCILRSVEQDRQPGDGEDRYFMLLFDRISDAAPSTHPPIPYSVEDLGGSDRRILWRKDRPRSTIVDTIRAANASRAGKQVPR